MKAKLYFILSFLFVFQISNSQTNITVWDYEPQNGALSNPTPNLGTGTSGLIINGTANTATTFQGVDATSNGCISTFLGIAWAINGYNPGTTNESNGVEYKSSTVGYDTIKFSWDQKWSSTATNTVRLQYTTDGSTWINFVMTGSNTTTCNASINSNGCLESDANSNSFKRTTVDFTAIPTANNNPNFGIRLLGSYQQSTTEFRQIDGISLANNAGTWRFDNVKFLGNLLGGPTASVLSGSTTVCGTTAVNIAVAITGGISPFTLTYNDSILGNVVVNNYISGTPISISPISTRNYSIVSVANSSNGALGTGNSGIATITVNGIPTIANSATAVAKCYSAILNSTTLSYSSITSAPNKYSITWNASPTNTFLPVSLATLTGGSITISIPAGTLAGVYTGYLVVKNTTTTCDSAIKTFTLTINAMSVTTQPATTAQTVCVGDSFSPISIVGAGPGLSYQWYRKIGPVSGNGSGGNALTTPNGFASEVAAGSQTATFTPLSNAIGTYYYYCRVNGICTATTSEYSGAFTVVAPPTVGTISSSQSICSGYAPSDLNLSGQIGTIVKWQKADDVAFTTNVVDIANTTTTLTSAAIGNLLQTTYFRAFITNGTCTRTTTPIQISVKTTNYHTIGGWDNGTPDSTTTAVFYDNFNSSGDLNACKVIISSGAVVINSNDSLIVQNNIDTTGGSLTFENNASLIQVNSIANVGTITYKRDSTFMNPYDYTYWSSPVLNQNLHNFSPGTLFDKYFYWNTTPSVYYWSVILNGAANMDIGKGYIIRSPLSFGSTAAIFHGIFTGIPNNGNYTTPIEVSGPLNGNSINLIGNPYPSAINATDFLNANGSVIEKTIYLWSHNTPASLVGPTYTSNDYASFDLTGGVGTHAALNTGVNNNIPNGTIASGQAFFVVGKSNGSAAFDNTMRISGNNNQFFRGSNSVLNTEKHRLWLEISNEGGAFSQTLFGYIDGATDAIDDGYDSYLFDDSPTASLYSVLNNEKLTIKGNALPFVETDTNQLGYISRAETDYEIKLALFDGVFNTQNVYLQDNLLNIIHDLKQSNYSFHSTIGTFNDRFVLRFTNTNLSDSENQVNENKVSVFNNNSNINIHSTTENIDSITVFDISGRLIYTNSGINKSNFNIENLKSSKQILLIQIKLNNGIVVNKKIIF